MQRSVLQPAARRRRRQRGPFGAPLALLLLAAVGVTLALAISALWREPGVDSRSAGARAALARAERATSIARPPAAPSRPRQLLFTLPVPRRTFRPPLTAAAAVLVDARTGGVVWAKRPHVRRPIASTTKIMTAVLALERLALTQPITIARVVPRATPFREGLRAGERVRAWKLLYGLMLYSGNDDALALAIGAAGSRGAFVALMNRKARELGLRNTQFSGPSGVIDRGNASSAWDVAALTRYAMRDAQFRAIVRTRVKRVRWSAPTYEKVYVNKNPLLGRYPGADGVKTGWTTLAGHCLVASAERRRVRLIAVVLGSADAASDARRLLDHGFRLARRGALPVPASDREAAERAAIVSRSASQ